MKIVPIMRCRNMAASLQFYRQVLDFVLKYPEATADDPVINLVKDEAELQLSFFDGQFGTPVNVYVPEVDDLFKYYISRGLDTSPKKESPVHQGPTDQTWGYREFYVNDPDGNTLRFCAPMRS